MNASRFQRENKLCTHRDSDSSHWTSVCLHNTLDTWTRMLCYIAGFAPTKYPVQASAPCQQCQRQAGRWLLLTSDRYQFQPTSQNKGSWFGNFPTFSRLFFPLSKSPASHYPNTLRLPPSWPKAFYHLPNLFQTQPNPKVCQNSLLPSYCTENLK